MRSVQPGALPLMMIHGWPGSIVEFAKVLRPLADPRSHGGALADAFDVIAPSIPGFGFSGPTEETVWDLDRVTVVFAELMERLGYDRYGAHGGDLVRWCRRHWVASIPTGSSAYTSTGSQPR